MSVDTGMSLDALPASITSPKNASSGSRGDFTIAWMSSAWFANSIAVVMAKFPFISFLCTLCVNTVSNRAVRKSGNRLLSGLVDTFLLLGGIEKFFMSIIEMFAQQIALSNLPFPRLFALANLLVVISVTIADYVHLNPDVPAEVLLFQLSRLL